ncbi:MAG: TIGR00159 family protein [Omnitrophica bacterium GWA2_52_8]|nr:MAG: TIGR00159 family protein [Omnitrophica bacterium GWA2_52_8]
MLNLLFVIWRPILEILFIWILVYNLIRFFQGTRALNVLMGLIVLAIIFNIAKLLELHTINWVLTKLFAVGVVAFLIIFQPELRRGLARIGQNTFLGGFLKKGGTVDELVQACEYLSRNHIGAIIAIERDMGLKNFIESGIPLDSKVSAELLITLFTPNTPTHDGGVILQGGRVAACGSLFPLSQNMDLARSLGTRHRAAIGLTEETDAVCIVVSEERGTISVAVYGKLTRDLDGEGLRRVLVSLFKSAETKQTIKEFLERNWRSFQGEKP